MNKNILFLTMTFFVSSQIFAQNKDIDKGKELLTKAFDQKDAIKKNEMITKCIELFTKGGMKKDMNHLIGDAFLEHNDLTQASSYYNRCDKVEKADGLKKLADAYTDLAFTDPKLEAKSLKSAVSFYQKSGTLKEGAKSIGDKLYEGGDKNLDKALDYYFMATDTASVEKVAKDFESKGGEKAIQSIDIFKRIGSKSALTRGGDLAYKNNQFSKAYEMYSAAENTDGLDKCAEKFFELGQVTESENVYLQMVTAYMKVANTEAVTKLAQENVKGMNFGLAAKIYDKAGDLNNSRKYYAYSKLMLFELDSAKTLLTANGETGLVSAIDKNMKYLLPLGQTTRDFDDYIKQQPSVGMEVDPQTGKYKPQVKDEEILITYYKNLKDNIVDGCHNISKNVIPISDSNLKKMLMTKYLDYPAVGKILDRNTFSIKLQKSSAQVKDVYLKKM